jgi:hypothetical protein
MSWCRFGWDGSDLYIFEDVHGHFVCMDCLLLHGDDNFVCATAREMYKHILEHEKAGHHVIPSLLEKARAAT